MSCTNIRVIMIQTISITEMTIVVLAPEMPEQFITIQVSTITEFTSRMTLRKNNFN